MHRRSVSVCHFGLLTVLLAGLLFPPQSSVHAAPVITVTPITWNVIGLDSNDPLTSGPENFPIGARVCNTSPADAATGVKATFDWGEPDTYDLFSNDANPHPYINLRPATNSEVNIGTLAANTCADAYFEVKVNRSLLAYEKTRRYHIDVTSTSPGGTVTTTTPRELFVEHLISQSRNYVYDIKLGPGYSGTGASVPPGGTMTLLVGQVYDITVNGRTATQGYNQLEEFINFPNTIFQILEVNTTYSADNSPAVPPPFENTTMLYGDACKWDNDLGSPTYRSCIGGDYKNGGSVDITYTVKILAVPANPPALVNPQPLSTLIYDFSGSSYHYNSDFGISTRYANILGPSAVTITKSFAPKAIAPGGTTQMKIVLTNPTTSTISDVNFTDGVSPAFPSGMQVAAAPAVSISNCGGGAFSPALTGGETSLTFTGATLAPNSVCTILVNMTATSNGVFENTTGHLLINSTTDTGNFGRDTLTASTAPACVAGQTLVKWSFPSTQVPAITVPNPVYDTGTRAADVSAGTTFLSFNAGATGGTESINTIGSPSANSWRGSGFQKNVTYTATTAPWFDISVDTSRYTNVSVSFRTYASASWADTNTLRVWSSADGGTTFVAASPATGSLLKTTWSAADQVFNTGATGTGTSRTLFRINAEGANPSGAAMNLDNITVTGCRVPPPPPTIAKAFKDAAGTSDVTSIRKGTSSVLRFTIANTAPGNQALSNISFTDVLPDGLSVASATTSVCGGTNNLVVTAATRTIALSGGILNAGASCSFDVTVTGVSAGVYDNFTSAISSAETGTSTNYGSDNLAVVAPPTITKEFGATTLFTGDSTSLTFIITNPNLTSALTGVSFTDNLPAGLVVSTPNGLTGACGAGSITAVDGSSTISLGSPTTATLAANSSCTFSVNVTGASTLPDNTKVNTTTNITSTEGGNGNAATASLVVNDLAAALELTKEISASGSTGPWYSFVSANVGSNVWYRFSAYNSGDVPFTDINVSDPALAAVAASLDPSSNCSWAAYLPLAPGETASCILGPTTAISGPHTNVASATGTHGSGTTPPDSSDATYGTPSVSLVKSVTQTSFASVGDTLDYSYVVTNSGSTPLLGPVTVADDKTTVSCPVVNTVGDGDDWLDPVDHPTAGNAAESILCTAIYKVTASDISNGFVTNIASATVGGITSNTSSKTVSGLPDFTVSKTNNVSGSVGQNGTFHWTITAGNISTAPATFSDNETILSDALPGVTGYYPQGALVVIDGGTPPTGAGSIDCLITGTALGCVANGTVDFPAGASFSVTFPVTPTAAGILANTVTVDPGNSVDELNETNNASINTVTVLAAPSMSKSFTPNPTWANQVSTLTFSITNPNAASALQGVSFSDSYPAGLVNATPLSTTNSCGGTLTAAAGGNSISLSGGSASANGSCTVSISVVSASGGTYANTSGNVSSTNGGTGNTATSTLVVFDAQPSKFIVTTSELSTGFVSGTERVTIGEMVRYRLVSRIPEGSFTNVQLLDGLPNGLQFLDDNTATAALVCNGGAACMTSSTLSGAGLVVNGASGTVSPTFVLPSSAISTAAAGTGTNLTFSLGNISNLVTDLDSEYVVVEFNALVKNVNSSAMINQGTNNQTGENVTNNRQNDVTLLVNGSMIGTASPNVTVSIAEPAITSITKAVTPSTGPYLPGDALTYTLLFQNTAFNTATNTVNTNAATAFDIVLSDTFNANLTLGAINVSSDQGASCAGGTTFTSGNSTFGQLVTVNISCLDPMKKVTVTISATIAGGTSSGTVIGNSYALSYTSLPGEQGNCASSPFTCTGVGTSGSVTGERNGTGGAGADGTVLNNYAAASNTVSAAVAYGSITIVLDAVPDHMQDFAYTGTGPGGYDFGGGFSLDDDADGTLPNNLAFISLAPGTYTVTQGSIAGWSLTGLVCTDPDSGSSVDLGAGTATIDLDGGENVTCTYTNSQLAASIVLTKTAILNDAVAPPAGVVNADDTITYGFSVENTGNLTVTNVTVADPLLPGLTCTIASLAPGQTLGCAATGNVYILTQADVNAGSRANTATATGKDPDGNDVSDPDNQTTLLTQVPSLTIVKSVTETSYSAVGAILHYSYLVTNTGNVTLTGPFTVTDDKSTDESCPATTLLIPGASITCSATYTVVSSDITNGSVTNIASAHGSFAGKPVDSATDTETVAATQVPSLTIVKSVTETSYSNAGDVLHYSYLVTNNGNVTLDGPFTVTDDKSTDESCPVAATLDPGASILCTATFVVAQADLDAGSVTNVAAAHGAFGGKAVDSATDTVTVNAAQSASLVITKSSDATGSNAVGDTITYTYDVENTGNVTLTNVTVTDDHAGLSAISCTPPQGSSLLPGETMSCTATYTVIQTDVDAGKIDNTGVVAGTPPTGPNITDSDPLSELVATTPLLAIVKEVSTSANGPWHGTSIPVAVDDIVYYRIRVSNLGDVTLTSLVVNDGMAGCTLVRGLDATGNNDNIFEVGEEWVYTCSVTAVLGTHNNTATADTSETPSVSDTASYIASAALVVDPAISKAGNPTEASVGETVTFTLVVTNQGTAPAPDVVVTDVLPSMFDVTSVNVSGAPFGTLVSVTPPIGTGTAPYTVVVTLGADLGVTDVVTIQIVTTVNGLGTSPINNTASLTTSASTDVVSNNSDSVMIRVLSSGAGSRSLLPATGFAPNMTTGLEAQPPALKYAATDLMLEIPSLGVKMPIVGVPKKNGTWNVTWLTNQAGWLEGSAFPSWSGNSVLTSHVYLSNGLPGPFIDLNKIKYGDQIIVYAYGHKYIFAVQTNTVVEPTDSSVLKHEEKSWLTLVTCKEYDEKTSTYRKRVVVRAVLVRADW